MVQFLDPETTEILPFLDPEIVKMDKKNSGSRNCRNGAISGSRNRRKGRQILYRYFASQNYQNFCGMNTMALYQKLKQNLDTDAPAHAVTT